MAPKEKAIELVDKFYDFKYLKLHYEQAKQCALIAVGEILNSNNQFIQTEEQFNYWKEVKQEIELL